MEAETLVEDPYAEFGGKKSNSVKNPYSEFGGDIVKKKVSTPDLSSTIPSSSIGLNPFQLSPQSTDLSPVLPQNREEVRQQQVQQRTAFQNQLNKSVMAANPELRQQTENDPLRQQETIQTGKEPTALQRARFGLEYITGNTAKGIASSTVAPLYYYANKVGLASDEDTKRVLDKINTSDKETFGIKPENLNNAGGVLGSAGGIAKMLPALITAEGTGGASFALQNIGDAALQVQQMKNSGVKFDNHSDDLYINGMGLVGLALGRGTFGKVFSKLPSGLRNNVMRGVVSDAMETLGKKGGDATAEDVAQTFMTKAATVPQRVLTHGIDALQTYAKVGTEMSGANIASFGLKNAANILNGDEKPFKDVKGEDFVKGATEPFYSNNFDDTGNPLKALANIATSTAGQFGILHGAMSSGMLFKGSPYENPIIDQLRENNSPENVESIKNDLTQVGKEKGLTDEEIANTHTAVDALAQTVGKLPKQLPKEKLQQGVSLIMGKNELQQELKSLTDERGKLDPSISDMPNNAESILTDKIDQANDKLRSLVTGDRITYSKGIGDDEGKFYKMLGGKKEEITENRYKLESLERDAKVQKNEQSEPTQEVPAKTPTDETAGKETPVIPTDETTENSPIKPTENESTNEKGSQENGSKETIGKKENAISTEEKVIHPGEAVAEPDITKPNENDRTTTTGGDNNARATETTPAEIQDKPNEEKNGEEKSEGTEVKKTILTKRAYEGDVAPEVKKHLEDKGLTRSSFTQEERSKQATDFINKFGEEAAHRAVEAGDVEGGMAASVLAQLQIRNSRAMAELPEGSEEREALAKKQANLISLMEKKGYLGGEFNGQLAHEYQNAELDYANVKKQVENLTGKPLTEAQDKKAKELTTENEKLKSQLQEAEAKLIEETDKAFNEGVESAKNETKAEKAKRIANKLRQNAKLHKPNVFSSANPASLVWDTAIEVVAKSIEAGGKLADAIDAGIEHIKKTDWYKSLPENRKTFAEREFKRFNNDHSGSTDLIDLQERFLDKKDNKFTPDEARDIWGYMKENYLNEGSSYRDAISKTAEDLGLSWRQISEAVITPKLKRQSDEMWKRQADYTRNRTAIKDWVGEQNKSKVGKALKKLSGLFRGVAVFGHGGIFMGTHAGMTLFNPSTWNKTIPAFFRGWKYAYGNEANFERSMEELKHSPNYLIAQRAGLKNNPDRINTEEYQKSQQYLGKLGMAGERGFNAVKVLRQDLFDYHFNKLTPAERDDPNVAKSIAHLVNLATGATNLKLPSWVNEASFAGGMEAARWEKLTASPLKASEVALNALLNPSKASTADKVFAKVWARRVGEQLATYSALLLANSAIQNSLNPKNPVNYTNPNKPDYMKFKFGDVTIDPTSGMRGVAMFMRTLGKIPFESKKELHGDKRIAVAGKDIANYGRGKLAPLYSTAADVFGGTDFNGNVMPYSKDKPNKGKHKLTWGEYGWSKAPLPIAEAANVAYQSAVEHGAHKPTLEDVLRGIMSGAISGTTGFRVGEYDAGAPKNKKH